MENSVINGRLLIIDLIVVCLIATSATSFQIRRHLPRAFCARAENDVAKLKCATQYQFRNDDGQKRAAPRKFFALFGNREKRKP
jgi:hypothetical protein